MRSERAIGACAAALVLGVLALSVGEASAGVPVACVRNLTGAEIDIALGSPPEQSNGWGRAWGRLAPHGGRCGGTDMSNLDAFYFRRVASLPPLAEGEVPTAAAGWKACPRHASFPPTKDGVDFMFTIRRGLFGVMCKIGGATNGLEWSGEYDSDSGGDE